MSYSASVQAEVYFRGLVGGQVVGEGGTRSRGGSGGKAPGGVRLVGSPEDEGVMMRGRSESGGAGGGVWGKGEGGEWGVRRWEVLWHWF